MSIEIICTKCNTKRDFKSDSLTSFIKIESHHSPKSVGYSETIPEQDTITIVCTKCGDRRQIYDSWYPDEEGY